MGLKSYRYPALVVLGREEVSPFFLSGCKFLSNLDGQKKQRMKLKREPLSRALFVIAQTNSDL